MPIAIDAALSGLRAAQAAMDVIANNISNASTPGYTRKILPLETQILAGTAYGVSLSAIQRSVDKLLVRDLALQMGASESQEITVKYLSLIQQFNGSSEAKQSLAAQVSTLSQSFAALSSSPEDPIALQKTLSSAISTAKKFNDFSALVTRLRNQTETDIASAIEQVNQALQVIGQLNSEINALASGNQGIANLEDERDRAVQIVAKYINVSISTGDSGKMVLTTKQGQVLVDDKGSTLAFQPANLLPTSYYPGGGINPITIKGVDVTTQLGGGLGALIALRDKTLPTYAAQADEQAQKLAARMEQQGLRLFTDMSGNVPASLPVTTPPAYVGFASLMRVNNAVVADPSLIRRGTTGNASLPGSNEVIRKISLFAFGAYAYQRAQGNVDISAGPVFLSAGLSQVNRVTGNVNIGAYTPDLTAGNAAIAVGGTFTIAAGGPPQTITIAAGETAASLVTKINTALGSTVASLNGIGQLTLDAPANIVLGNGTLGATGLGALGLTAGTYNAQNPSFNLQIGTRSPIAITIGPADTAATLLAQINAIAGVTASLTPGGELLIEPTEGGDIKLTNTVGTPLAALGISISNIAHVPFRQSGVGPDGTLSTGLLANATLEDYARSIMQGISEDSATAQSGANKEKAYLDLLDKRHKDQSGVNIDEEMSNMLRIQSNYTAAAKALKTSEELLDTLLQILG